MNFPSFPCLSSAHLGFTSYFSQEVVDKYEIAEEQLDEATLLADDDENVAKYVCIMNCAISLDI